MGVLSKHATLRKGLFFLLIFLTLSPLLLFHLLSDSYHSVYRTRPVEDAILDLSGCDLSLSHGVPLDGTWEFYYGRLIGAQGKPSQPDFMAQVPLPWSRFDRYGVSYPKDGVCSYRMTLINCPGTVPLTIYIPNLSSAYRIYINGDLISRRAANEFGERVEPKSKLLNVYNEFRLGVVLPKGSSAEVVVELKGDYVGGLYSAPVLANAELDANHSQFNRFLTSAYVGILIVCIVSFAAIMLGKDPSFHSLALLMLDLLVLARVMLMDEFYEITQMALPFLRQYWVGSLLQALTLFLPAVFIVSIRQMIHLEVSKKILALALAYEFIFVSMSLWCAITGRPHLRHTFCELSYLPIIYVIYKLYRSVSANTPYALTVSAILLLSMCSMMGADLRTSGRLLINIALFPSTCFVIAILLQLVMYLRKRQEVQLRAAEAEHLALQLRDSRLSLTLSQIKPHFLYNTLLAIHMLCLQAPADAAEAVLMFSNYLRTNMRFISSDKLILFSQEMTHITNYVAIEKLRFGERLAFHAEVVESDFLLPPLSIQPIVENAIKHGACKNLQGGTVTLRAYAEAARFCVEVTDDGPGFDVGLLEAEQADSVGLNNIRFRLREQVGALVEIESRRDQGTRVLVSIPRGGAHESDTD